MQRGKLGTADKIALIALAGVVLALLIWLSYAVVDSLLQGHDLTTELVNPELGDAFKRSLAIVAVLLGTLLVQALSAHSMRAAEALMVEQNRTRQIYENSPDRIVCLDPTGTVLYANPKAGGDGTPLTPGEADHCFEHLYGRDALCDSCDLEEVVRTGRILSAITQEEGPDGSDLWFDRLLYPIFNADGSVESVVETARDVTALKLAQDALERSHRDLESRIEQRTSELRNTNSKLTTEIAERERVSEALKDSEERYRRLIEHSPDMILVHQNDHVTFVNPAGLELLGAEHVDEAIGRDVLSLWAPGTTGVSGDELQSMIVDGDLEHPVPLRLRRFDGGCVDVEVTVSRLVLDGSDYVQCVARDITQRLRAEETIRRMAYYDALTGLPNRTLFKDRLGRALTLAKREHGAVAVAFLDLDDFKAINDTLGHSVGDELLKAVGGRISGLLRENDTVARHSGDEFTIIARMHAEEDVDRFAHRVLDGLRPAFQVSGHDLHITGSLGVALYPRDGADVDELLKNADAAMYHAKDLGQSQYTPYRAEMGVAALDRLVLENELRRAAERGEFELHYQPQVDLRTNAIVGVEALLRWNHPDQGLLGPAAFLAVAEQAGLMGHLGRWVLAEACAQARSWLDDGLPVQRIAVNLSAQEFLRHDVVSLVAQTLARTGVPADVLEIEITEGVALQSLEHVLATLTSLRTLGVRIAIDDFGTGYSSMSYLQRFPIQTLKIDRSFMSRVADDEHSAAIASMLVDLCRQLNLDIVAEGIEHEAQRVFLAERGCITAQGNLFCEPLPAEAITRVLRNGLPRLSDSAAISA